RGVTLYGGKNAALPVVRWALGVGRGAFPNGRKDVFVTLRAGSTAASAMLLIGRLLPDIAAKMPLLHLFVGRSGLSVGRARIVGVTFLSRFGLQSPPPHINLHLVSDQSKVYTKLPNR